MKKALKRTAVLTALLLLSNSLAGFAICAKELPADAITPESRTSLPVDAPAFHACIEYSFQGYVVKGSFQEIPSNISLIQPMFSLDGAAYQDCGDPWDLTYLNENDDGAQEKLQNQIILYSNQEPLKSYLDRKLDHFCIKLHLSLKNGTAYETQAAFIDRGNPQPVPKELHPDAFFAPSLAVYETRPFCGYGKYQLTVSANATPEEITSCLPDTLPMKISLAKGIQHMTDGIVDCPVTWKPLSLPRLAAGESVTIDDAAEKIMIPKGSLLNTPTGVFRFDEPLGLSDQYGLTDKVQLVLNAVPENGEPTGVLKEENAGLEMAFDRKPTGATDIQAYVWFKNSPEWIHLPGLSLLDAVNGQPSTASSGYALVIRRDQDPYRSYLAAKDAGDAPEPFLIGLTIKGGIYDGRQMILAWPDTYELPPALPKLGGMGGNEANAGSDNKNDSTPEGQRPNLPQNPEELNSANLPQDSNNTPSKTSPTIKKPDRSSQSGRKTQRQSAAQPPSNNDSTEKSSSAGTAAGTKNNAQTKTAANAKNASRSEAEAQSENNNTPTTAEAQNASTEIAQPATPAPASSDTNELADAEDSSLQEIPNGTASGKDRRTLPPSAATAAAIMSVIIAAAIRRLIAGKDFRQILNNLQKFHYKRRTLARR